MVKYLEKTELEDLAGDAFILLVNIFDEKSVKEATTEFIKKLIDSMPHIVDENTLHALMSILVVVFPYFEKVYSNNNPIMTEFLLGSKTDYYKTEIMYLTNRGSMYRLDKCMQAISVLLQGSDSENFFNENDVDIIMGICLRELGTPNSSRTRLQTLRVLNLILEHPTYL